MELITTLDFEKELGAFGIALDPRYPLSNSLTFVNAPGLWCPWEPPAKGEDFAWFVRSVLETAAKDQVWNVYPHHSVWPSHWDGPMTPLEVVCHGAGVPHCFEGAARFSPDEFGAVVALAAGSLLFGETVWEDLYFIPSDGGIMLMTSHHWQMIVTTSSDQRLDLFAEDLRKIGIPHPNDEVGEAD